MHHYFKILCIVFFAATIAQAQPIRENSFAQKLEAAQLAEEQANYAGALDWYEKVYDELKQTSGRRSSNPAVKQYYLKIAELDYKLRDYKRAEKKLKKNP